MEGKGEGKRKVMEVLSRRGSGNGRGRERRGEGEAGRRAVSLTLSDTQDDSCSRSVMKCNKCYSIITTPADP